MEHIETRTEHDPVSQSAGFAVWSGSLRRLVRAERPLPGRSHTL